MSTVTPSAAEYSRITPELMQLTGLWAEHAHIDRELYQRYNVKRGLRDANGRGVLASLTRISEVKGVYVPFWLFDADADAHIRYHATRIRTWSDRDYDYTETQHYAILRSGDLSFTHVPVDGSSRMPNDLMESIEPFDFSSAVDFQTAYLSGYLADRYDVNADDSIGRANERVKKSTESVFASTVVGYHTVVPESTSVRLANGRVRYALYPVWLLNTVWNGKTFSFAMNGQTGKFVGDLPVDQGKKWRWFGLVSGIAAAAAYGLVCLWQLLH